jgi:hypothetical protein
MTVFWDVVPCRPDDGGIKHLWNVGKLLLDYTAQHPRRQSSSKCALLMGECFCMKLFYAVTSPHVLDQRFSNCGTGTPWGTRDAFQGYHKFSFIYILTASIKHELWAILCHKYTHILSSIKINITKLYCVCTFFSISNTNVGCVFYKFLLHGVPDFSLTLSGVAGTKSLRTPVLDCFGTWRPLLWRRVNSGRG